MGEVYQIDWHQPRSPRGLPIEQQPIRQDDKIRWEPLFKGTLSRVSLQTSRVQKHILQQRKTYEYWSSFVKKYNARVMKLKKSSIIVIPPGPGSRSGFEKKSA